MPQRSGKPRSYGFNTECNFTHRLLGFNTERTATHRLLRCAATPLGKAATRSERVATRSVGRGCYAERVATPPRRRVAGGSKGVTIFDAE